MKCRGFFYTTAFRCITFPQFIHQGLITIRNTGDEHSYPVIATLVSSWPDIRTTEMYSSKNKIRFYASIKIKTIAV